MFQKHNEEPQKTLIIVCDEKENSCANYLIQLIGDKNDNNIDLNVKAVLYNTKTYRDNLGQIPSSQRVLFIGVNKFTKEQVGTIPDKYNELDMHFGWLGKRAVLYVDDITVSGVNKPKEVFYLIRDEIFHNGYRISARKSGIKRNISAIEINGVIITRNGELRVPNRINKKLMENKEVADYDFSAKASVDGLRNYKRMIRNAKSTSKRAEK